MQKIRIKAAIQRSGEKNTERGQERMNELDFCSYEVVIDGDGKSEQITLKLDMRDVPKAKQEKIIHEFEILRELIKETFS